MKSIIEGISYTPAEIADGIKAAAIKISNI
jgi:hypothetical protein